MAETLEDVQKKINTLKAELNLLLKHKKILLARKQDSEGCNCGTIIHEFDAVRLHNRYCPIHGDDKP